MNNIALLISGGVDSSVAALQLVELGYKPTLFILSLDLMKILMGMIAPWKRISKCVIG